MNNHERYTQQAAWTRELRTYLFAKAGLSTAKRVLEVGCGTGAILHNLATHASSSIHGLDLSPSALAECRLHAPAALLTQGDACLLPYPPETFDIVYCHFLLLWIAEPRRALQEMKRVTVHRGCILALAEPDYTGRVDQPAELACFGRLQAESLHNQGADITIGSQLADLFHQSGIRTVEAGVLRSRSSGELSSQEWENERTVLEADLAGIATAGEIERMRALDLQARQRGRRVLYVPTYFAWGQV